MAFKTEREWKDIDSASRRVMLIGLIVFLGMAYGIYNEASKAQQIQKNIVNTQMVRSGR